AETLASLLYARDNDGQVKSVTSKGLPGEEKPSYEYDSNNRLVKGATIGYEYDAADNATKIGTGGYAYDKASELETGPSLKYTYNEMGQRTKTSPTTGSATTYAYDQAGSLTAVERPHRSHHDTARLRRPIHQHRHRPHIPQSTSLRPRNRPVPHRGPTGQSHTRGVQLRQRQPRQQSRSDRPRKRMRTTPRKARTRRRRKTPDERRRSSGTRGD